MRYNFETLKARISQEIGKPEKTHRDGSVSWKYKSTDLMGAETDVVLSPETVFCATGLPGDYDKVLCAVSILISQIDEVRFEKLGEEDAAKYGFLHFVGGDGADIARVRMKPNEI